MTQAEVLNYLKKNGPASTRKIAEDLDKTFSSVSESIKKMKKYDEIETEKQRKPWSASPVGIHKLTLEDRKKVAQLEFKK